MTIFSQLNFELALRLLFVYSNGDLKPKLLSTLTALNCKGTSRGNNSGVDHTTMEDTIMVVQVFGERGELHASHIIIDSGLLSFLVNTNRTGVLYAIETWRLCEYWWRLQWLMNSAHSLHANADYSGSTLGALA